MKYTRESKVGNDQSFWTHLFDQEFTVETALLMFGRANRELCFGRRGDDKICFSTENSYENNRNSTRRLVVLRDSEGNDIGRVSKYRDTVTIDRLV